MYVGLPGGYVAIQVFFENEKNITEMLGVSLRGPHKPGLPKNAVCPQGLTLTLC